MLLINKSNTLTGRLTLVIKTLTGQTITRDLPPRATIADLKARLQKTEHIPPDQLYLLFGGKLLTDLRTLADYKMQSGDTVHMVLRLGGGIQCTCAVYVVLTYMNISS